MCSSSEAKETKHRPLKTVIEYFFRQFPRKTVVIILMSVHYDFWITTLSLQVSRRVASILWTLLRLTECRTLCRSRWCNHGRWAITKYDEKWCPALALKAGKRRSSVTASLPNQRLIWLASCRGVLTLTPSVIIQPPWDWKPPGLIQMERRLQVVQTDPVSVCPTAGEQLQSGGGVPRRGRGHSEEHVWRGLPKGGQAHQCLPVRSLWASWYHAL